MSIKSIASIASILSIFSIVSAQRPFIPDAVTPAQHRVDQVMTLIDGNYTESPDMEKLSTEAINAMLKALDPHSVYIPAKDVQRANEPLEGNFEGVGISFQIVQDTIVVGSVIDGGPSEKVGLMVGDKIIRIDNLPATGDSITNQFVFTHLRGKKGTTVHLDLLLCRERTSHRLLHDDRPGVFRERLRFLRSDLPDEYVHVRQVHDRSEGSS